MIMHITALLANQTILIVFSHITTPSQHEGASMTEVMHDDFDPSCRNCTAAQVVGKNSSKCTRCTSRIMAAARQRSSLIHCPPPSIVSLQGDLKAGFFVPLRPGNVRGRKKAAFGMKKKSHSVTMKKKNYHKYMAARRVKVIATQHGRGLAAISAFKAGETITCYAGRTIITSENLGTKAGRARALAAGGSFDWTYLVQLANGEYREGGQAEDIRKGRLGSLINDPHGRVNDEGKPLMPNCEYSESEVDGEVYVRAIRCIAAGEELLSSYIVWMDATNLGTAESY